MGASFSCRDNKLTSLKGCPVKVGGSFDCYNNRLVSLEFCIKDIGSNFECGGNMLKEADSFLYDYTAQQIFMYYSNKNLNGKLFMDLSEEVAVGIKKKL